VRLAWLPETAQAVFTAVGKIQTFERAGLRLSPRKRSSRSRMSSVTHDVR
jgi:hypothetical protein